MSKITEQREIANEIAEAISHTGVTGVDEVCPSPLTDKRFDLMISLGGAQCRACRA